MLKQLILHIGDCKTGSTAIQSMLAGGHYTSRDLRLFYPGQLAHGALARSLGDRHELYPKRWQGVARRLAKTDWDVAVLSSELFEFTQPAKVARALRENLPAYADTVKVIAYIRPHAGRVLSQFSENLKLGHETGDLEQSVDRILALGRLHYCERLDRWKAEFGDRLIVRPFARDHLTGGDVRRDFLSRVLGDATFEISEGQDNNNSLCLSDLAMMRFLQRRFGNVPDIDIESRVAFGKQFGQLLHAHAPEKPQEKLRLTRTLYDRIAQSCMDDAQRMDSDWAGAPCFVPALEHAAKDTIAAPQNLNAEDHHSAETLRQARVWGDLILRQMGDPAPELARRLRPKLSYI